jgi:calnexin
MLVQCSPPIFAESKAAHHAISAVFPEPISVVGTNAEEPARVPLVVQYEVKTQKGLECGGAYLKLLTENPGEGLRVGEDFTDKTPFTIMFGPDKCGATNKVHLIFRHKNPKTGEYEEKHLINPPVPKIGKHTALYTLIVNPDNTYEIKINDESVKSGSLLEDFDPPVMPPKEIDDPTDSKPANWVDEPLIEDATAKKVSSVYRLLTVDTSLTDALLFESPLTGTRTPLLRSSTKPRPCPKTGFPKSPR